MYNEEKVSSLVLENEQGEKKVYYKLSEFSIKGKNNNYILYTDYSKTDGKINIYYGILENHRMTQVTDENDIKIISNYIKSIEKDIQSGIKF